MFHLFFFLKDVLFVLLTKTTHICRDFQSCRFHLPHTCVWVPAEGHTPRYTRRAPLAPAEHPVSQGPTRGRSEAQPLR